MTTKRWYVYTLEDPREPGIVRYVGSTTNFQRRRSMHGCKSACIREDTVSARWKLKILNEGVAPFLKVIDSGTTDACIECEAKWIAFYRDKFKEKLTNTATSGSGFKISEEHKAKISATLKGRARPHEVKEKIRATKRRRKLEAKGSSKDE